MARNKRQSAKQPRSDRALTGDDAAPRQRGFRAWARKHRRDLRFVSLFGLYMVIYYGLTLTPQAKNTIFPAYLELNARLTSKLLNTFGMSTYSDDKKLGVVGDKNTEITVERGCDAMAPSALFVAAVLASPAGWLSRLAAALVGTLLLMLVNFVRIVSLFLIKIWFERAFDFMHIEFWQFLFIAFAVFLWALWASKAAKRMQARHVPA